MSGTLELRPALPSDIPFLAAVYASVRQDELAPTGWPAEAKTAFLQQQFTAQHHHYHTHYPDADYLVILLNRQPIGRMYVARWEHEIRLMDIALLPSYRNQGIGTRLLRGLLDEAAASGKSVSLHVEAHNPAMRLYERLGFRRIRDTGIYWLMEWGPATLASVTAGPPSNTTGESRHEGASYA